MSWEFRGIPFSGREWVGNGAFAFVLFWYQVSLLFSIASYSIMVTTIRKKPFVFLILQLILLKLSFIDKVILPLPSWGLSLQEWGDILFRR